MSSNDFNDRSWMKIHEQSFHLTPDPYEARVGSEPPTHYDSLWTEPSPGRTGITARRISAFVDADPGCPFDAPYPTPRWPLDDPDGEATASIRKARQRGFALLSTSALIFGGLLGIASGSILGFIAAVVAGMALPLSVQLVPTLRSAVAARALADVRTAAAARREEEVSQLSTAHRVELESLEDMVEGVRGFQLGEDETLHQQLAARLDEALRSFVDVAAKHRRLCDAFSAVDRPADQPTQPGDQPALQQASSTNNPFAERNRNVAQFRHQARAQCREQIATASQYLETLSQVIKLAYERTIASALDTSSLKANLDQTAEELDIVDRAYDELHASLEPRNEAGSELEQSARMGEAAPAT